ncbi:MAG: hypothetical protein ACOCXJ_09060, partial [Planctomycetota bacterium]
MATPRLQVSRASAGFLRRGHPWLRPDRFTRGLERLQHGQVVNLVDDQGRALASALIDREHPEICARVFHRRPDRNFDPTAALARAWQRRAALHADPDTDAYRIVHGEADFLPGARLERYGDCLVLLLQAPCLRPWRDSLAAASQALLPQATLVLREQYNDLRQREVF